MNVRVRHKAGGGSLHHDCCCHSDALKGRANWLQKYPRLLPLLHLIISIYVRLDGSNWYKSAIIMLCAPRMDTKVPCHEMSLIARIPYFSVAIVALIHS